MAMYITITASHNVSEDQVKVTARASLFLIGTEMSLLW